MIEAVCSDDWPINPVDHDELRKPILKMTVAFHKIFLWNKVGEPHVFATSNSLSYCGENLKYDIFILPRNVSHERP